MQIEVRSYLYFKHLKPELSCFRLDSTNNFITRRAQAELLKSINLMKLDYILTNREYIKNYVVSAIEQDAVTYGIHIKGMEIESISMGRKLEHDIARVALGRIEAQANMIIAKGELEAAKMVASTAEINGDNPIGL